MSTELAVTRRANVVGTGLIGGSVGLALRSQGWFVTGDDHDHERSVRAAEIGAIDAVGFDDEAVLTFVAVPVGAAAELVRGALVHGGVVTDVGSVKAPVVDAVDHERFVGGHPMAGSEALGLDGARA
ncbi:MAG: prephenate dehydrogenase/arogenate dehydrogenase family protein, partial [Actinomycetes bacterium]